MSEHYTPAPPDTYALCIDKEKANITGLPSWNMVESGLLAVDDFITAILMGNYRGIELVLVVAFEPRGTMWPRTATPAENAPPRGDYYGTFQLTQYGVWPLLRALVALAEELAPKLDLAA